MTLLEQTFPGVPSGSGSILPVVSISSWVLFGIMITISMVLLIVVILNGGGRRR